MFCNLFNHTTHLFMKPETAVTCTVVILTKWFCNAIPGMEKKSLEKCESHFLI